MYMCGCMFAFIDRHRYRCTDQYRYSLFPYFHLKGPRSNHLDHKQHALTVSKLSIRS